MKNKVIKIYSIATLTLIFINSAISNSYAAVINGATKQSTLSKVLAYVYTGSTICNSLFLACCAITSIIYYKKKTDKSKFFLILFGILLAISFIYSAIYRLKITF